MQAVGPASTTAELMEADDAITAELNGSMSDVERAWLVEYRTQIRLALAKRQYRKLQKTAQDQPGE